MPWTARGQFCMYCTHYLSMGNLSRHLYTCLSFEGRFSTEKAKEALVLQQKNKASYFRKYALTGFEVKEILDEFVGKQLTTHMGELILQKAGHRMVNSVHCDTMESVPLMDTADTEKVGVKKTAAQNWTPLMLPESRSDSMTSHEVQLPGAGAVYCEKRAVKRIPDKNTEANTFPQNVAKVRKESEDEKTGDCLRTDISKYVQPISTVCIEGMEYAGLFPSMKVIVERYSRMNENACDVTPFIRPSEGDFREVSAFLMRVLLNEKRHMPRICQNMKLSDVINPRINSSGARNIEVNTVGGNHEHISVNKELHEFLLAYKIAMRGVMEGDNNPCTSHFFRNTKGICFSYGIGKSITRFRDKYMLGLHKNEITSDDTKVSEMPLDQKKAQTKLVENFVCNVLSDMYPFMNEPPTVKQIEKAVETK